LPLKTIQLLWLKFPLLGEVLRPGFSNLEKKFHLRDSGMSLTGTKPRCVSNQRVPACVSPMFVFDLGAMNQQMENTERI
jgi:hypothetical protein